LHAASTELIVFRVDAWINFYLQGLGNQETLGMGIGQENASKFKLKFLNNVRES